MGDLSLINTFAARQYGCFSVAQARDAGFDRNAVGRRIANGSWARLGPGVYAVTSAPPIWERQLAAAVLSEPRAKVAGASAAYLHGLARARQGRPVIVVPAGAGSRSSIAKVMRSTFFDEIATSLVKGFEVTTPAETVFALAGSRDSGSLDSILEDALLTGKATLDELTSILERVAGSRARGAGRLRALVEQRHPGDFDVESTYLERLLERVLADPRIPEATREFGMTINGARARVDAYVPEWGLVIEADSRRWHSRSNDFEADRARDNALVAAGLKVVRLTYRMLKDDPDGCLNTILQAGSHQRVDRVG